LGDDGRIHPQWHIATNTTGRLICSKPALQALPSDYRKYFVPDEGCCYVTVDFKAIDLRVLAKQSGDESLISNLKEGKDIHTATAASIFRITPNEVTKAQRQIGKRTNFAITYGCSEHGLANMLSAESGTEITPNIAKNYIEGFMLAYPKVSSYQWKLRKGRIVPKTIEGKTFNVGGRKALNYPIQGSTAEGFLKVLDAVQEKLGPTDRLVMAIHDSITIECENDRKDEVTNILVTTALSVMGTYLAPVPVFVDVYNHI
jgi:DNA polymerase-1